MTNATEPLPADWPQFWAHVQCALAYATQHHKPRQKIQRFVREMRRRVGHDPRYHDPRAVADLIERIWAERPEVRQAGRAQ
jgi:hypothetical protein